MIILQQTTAARNAYEIQQETTALAQYTRAALLRIHALANEPGLEQEVLNQFGQNAAEAVIIYKSFATVMNMVQPNSVPLPDMEVFQLQADGSVLFVAPSSPSSPTSSPWHNGESSFSIPDPD
jgi:hypothetical protein